MARSPAWRSLAATLGSWHLQGFGMFSVIEKASGRWVGRVGAPLVSIGFLTVGVQSAINFSAGVLRMPQRRFQPAVIIGALLWATLYTTVGLAVVDAWLGHVPWWWALLGVAVVVLLIVVSRRITRRAEA